MRGEEVNLEEAKVIVLRSNVFNGRFIVNVFIVVLVLPPFKGNAKDKVTLLDFHVD